MDLQLMLSRIENFCEARNLKRQKVYIESGVGKDFGGTIRNGSEPSIGKIFAVATRLDCSVDYLLGRTNDPLSHKCISITVGDISGNQNLIGGSHSNVFFDANNITSQEIALLNHFHSLDETKKAKVLLYAAELAEEK